MGDEQSIYYKVYGVGVFYMPTMNSLHIEIITCPLFTYKEHAKCPLFACKAITPKLTS